MLLPPRASSLTLCFLLTSTAFASTPPELVLGENVRLKATTPTCKGISRPVFEESQLHFPSVSAAQSWLARHSRHFDTVWTNDGLVVQWGVTPSRYQINVDLKQLCVQGRRPDALAGASEAAIQVTRTGGSGPLRQDCVQVGRAIEQHTERLWDAHWKQADFMNAGHRKPATPASGTSVDATH